MRETWVQSLVGKTPLGEGMATHSSILAWRIPWTEEPGGLQCMRSQRVRHDWATQHSTYSKNKTQHILPMYYLFYFLSLPAPRMLCTKAGVSCVLFTALFSPPGTYWVFNKCWIISASVTVIISIRCTQAEQSGPSRGWGGRRAVQVGGGRGSQLEIQRPETEREDLFGGSLIASWGNSGRT